MGPAVGGTIAGAGMVMRGGGHGRPDNEFVAGQRPAPATTRAKPPARGNVSGSFAVMGDHSEAAAWQWRECFGGIARQPGFLAVTPRWAASLEIGDQV
jgi:hypothetical protein